MPTDPSDVERGAVNLLTRAAGLAAGDKLAIVHEDSGVYYEPEMVAAVAEAGRRLGAEVALHRVAFAPLAATLPDGLREALATADRIVFLARIGDQLRFADLGVDAPAVVSYALDRRALGSPFGTADHRAFIALMAAIDDVLVSADHIHVTCPGGTDFSGSGPGRADKRMAVGVSRFPMPVFTPLPAAGFSGRVALPGFLVGTGSMYYQPYALDYRGALFAHFEAGRLTRFSGAADAIEGAEAHYRRVAGMLGIDARCVHSWHAGIHPGCAFDGPASASYERWSGSAFGNPRVLHFHTCGDYAPGEISWNVVDPTIVVDGKALWRDGVLNPGLIPGGADILARHPCARAAFDRPAREIGLPPVATGG